VPARTFGNDTSWVSGSPVRALVNGRVMISLPFDPTAYPCRLGERKKKFPSIPKVWQSSSHIPAFTRNPFRKSSFSRRSPMTAVPGLPRAPATARGVPAGAVVRSGGVFWPDTFQKSHSPEIQTRPGGPHRQSHALHSLQVGQFTSVGHEAAGG